MCRFSLCGHNSRKRCLHLTPRVTLDASSYVEYYIAFIQIPCDRSMIGYRRSYVWCENVFIYIYLFFLLSSSIHVFLYFVIFLLFRRRMFFVAYAHHHLIRKKKQVRLVSAFVSQTAVSSRFTLVHDDHDAVPNKLHVFMSANYLQMWTFVLQIFDKYVLRVSAHRMCIHQHWTVCALFFSSIR